MQPMFGQPNEDVIFAKMRVHMHVAVLPVLSVRLLVGLSALLLLLLLLPARAQLLLQTPLRSGFGIFSLCMDAQMGRRRRPQGRAEQSRAEQSRGEQSRAEQSRAVQRVGQSTAEQSRAEQSRVAKRRAE